jgi:hypothetical protein
MRFEDYERFCTTDRQRKVLAEYIAGGQSSAVSGKSLGIADRTIRKMVALIKSRAAAGGLSPEHGLTTPYPDGYQMGKVTIQRNAEGVIERTWERMCSDAERKAEMLKEAFASMADDLPRVSKRSAPKGTAKDLMACYPVGDAHIGMLSWPEETGDDWNLDIALKAHLDAINHLVLAAPPCEQAVIVNLGDWLHYDNFEGVTTRSGHSLDTDGRYAKMARVAVMVMRRMIETALEHHKHVRVINVIGNHDDTGAIWMATCLAAMYEREKRVTIDSSPAPFHYFRFGKVLVGTHHGHSCKPDRLPGVMATDMAQDWGECDFRYWWLGHVHHQNVKEYSGVTVESFNTLAAKDAYATWGGYRANRNMRCIVLHREMGEWARHTFSIAPTRRRAEQ